MVTAGADIWAKNQAQESVLYIAALKGYDEVVRVLLEAMNSTGGREEGRTGTFEQGRRAGARRVALAAAPIGSSHSTLSTNGSQFERDMCLDLGGQFYVQEHITWPKLSSLSHERYRDIEGCGTGVGWLQGYSQSVLASRDYYALVDMQNTVDYSCHPHILSLGRGQCPGVQTSLSELSSTPCLASATGLALWSVGDKKTEIPGGAQVLTVPSVRIPGNSPSPFPDLSDSSVGCEEVPVVPLNPHAKEFVPSNSYSAESRDSRNPNQGRRGSQQVIVGKANARGQLLKYGLSADMHSCAMTSQHQASDGDGYSPVHAACIRRSAGTVKLLLEAGFSADVRNKYQQTPLHLAARAGEVECVLTLLGEGADPCAVDKEEQTPLDMAIRHKKDQVTKLLEARGGKRGQIQKNTTRKIRNGVLKGRRQGSGQATVLGGGEGQGKYSVGLGRGRGTGQGMRN
ncbi:unnamed protein product [Choristocarpus tenellus]